MNLYVPKNRYKVGLVIFASMIVAPVIVGILLSTLVGVYPNDCDVVARCKHAIVGFAQSLNFGLIFVGPILMLFGALGTVVLGAVWGMRGFQSQRRHRRSSGASKYIIGPLCAGMLVYLVYIPKGPDPCSRVITDTQYENCLEKTFAGMSFSETHRWLEDHGYSPTADLTATYRKGPAPWIENGAVVFTYDKWFQAFRNHGKTKSVPYGTNFNRIFARIGPAPDRFEIDVFGWDAEDRVTRVRVSWAFEFL